jgi:alcohol dehydrogenase
MENFTFQNPTRILFGKGMEAQVGQEARHWGQKVLLHYGGESAKKMGLLQRVINSLNEAGVEYVELPGVKPNPRLTLVREGIQLCRHHKIDLILAVGGGSVIDSAKAIAAGVPYDGDVWDFFTEKAILSQALPVGTILTIPAAGSEASTGTVITNEDGLLKIAFNSDFLYPRFSILNPQLAYSLPKYQVACGAADIIAHIFERYFTNTTQVEFTDRLLEATAKTVIHHVPFVLAQPDNYDSWAEVMWAGTIAHNNLLNTGRTSDWGSHEIEHEISGIYDVAHGAGLAAVFPAWMKYVYKHNVSRFVQFATRIWNVDNDIWNPEATALEGITRYEAFMKSIGMPTRLSEMDICDDRLEEMALKATRNNTRTIGNFVPLYRQDIYNILKLAQ